VEWDPLTKYFNLGKVQLCPGQRKARGQTWKKSDKNMEKSTERERERENESIF
jgi:hypothetical protein